MGHIASFVYLGRLLCRMFARAANGTKVVRAMPLDEVNNTSQYKYK